LILITLFIKDGTIGLLKKDIKVFDREMRRKKNLLIQNHISLEVTNER